MSFLSPRLQLRVAQKQILTPGLVQMVTVLQLNRLELREMINQEIAQNPVLEEAAEEAGEELSPEEVQALLEAERLAEPADQSILEAVNGEGYLPQESFSDPQDGFSEADRETSAFRWQVKWVPLNEGLVDWRQVLTVLKGFGFSGPFCFHAEQSDRTDEQRVEITAKDCAWLRPVMAKLGF